MLRNNLGLRRNFNLPGILSSLAQSTQPNLTETVKNQSYTEKHWSNNTR
nr:hypothetical protein [Synechocystis sp. PCC 7509]